MDPQSTARELDEGDVLAPLRDLFEIPTVADIRQAVGAEPTTDGTDPCVYLCGNSLGLMPRTARARVHEELQTWATRAVLGHFAHAWDRPWAATAAPVRAQLARLTGSRVEEVTVMSSLTVNLHALLTPFYRPTATRYKVVMEERAFPSDTVGDGADVLVACHSPGSGSTRSRRRCDCTAWRSRTRSSGSPLGRASMCCGRRTWRAPCDHLALVLLGGVQYYSGRVVV